jgi:pimeloyl-ACP methyl ester carboxylesterase
MTLRNPRIRLVDVPGAGHYVHDDAPEPFHHHFTRFLRSAEAVR